MPHSSKNVWCDRLEKNSDTGQKYSYDKRIRVISPYSSKGIWAKLKKNWIFL